MNYTLRVLSYYIFDFQIPIKAVNLMHLSANLTQVGLYSACPAHLVKMTESLILGYAVQVKLVVMQHQVVAEELREYMCMLMDAKH
jgi:hypothetical protein